MSKLTKKTLSDALLSLLDEKPISKITITDITDRADVNRHTFYYHFKNIDDLISYYFSEKADQLIKRHSLHASWEDSFLSLLEFAKENSKYILIIIHSPSSNVLYRLFNELASSFLVKFVDKFDEGSELNEADKKFIVDFYKHAVVGIILDWLDSYMMESPKKLIAKIDIMLSGQIKSCVDRFIFNSLE